VWVTGGGKDKIGLVNGKSPVETAFQPNFSNGSPSMRAVECKNGQTAFQTNPNIVIAGIVKY